LLFAGISLWVWIALLAAAGVAGAVNAIAGGGTFLTFPMLMGAGHLNEKVANATNTLALWPGSASSVYAATHNVRKIPRGILVSYSIISAVGGVVGAYLLIHTPPADFKQIIPWLLLFATVIFAFSKPIARWAGRQHGRPTLGWTIIVGIIQMVVAIYGGYFGAGMGVLMMAGLAFSGLQDIHQTNALKAIMATIINIAATVLFALVPGMIDWRFGPPMAITAIIGGFLGMRLANRINPAVLRGIILATGVLLTAVYFYRSMRS
jgi:uncharacterized membrane protein YfcA